METVRSFCVALTLIFLALAGPPAASAQTAAGHWEGEITLPTMKLGIRVDLTEKDHAWSGTIDIPAQALRGFKLGEVNVKSPEVGFLMPGIPGGPIFKGMLAADAKTIAGNFTQGGQTFPFTLVRTEAPQEIKGLPGEGLPGHWLGTLNIPPGIELRLALEISDKDGKLTGTLISLDQGSARIPIALTKDGENVHLEAVSIGGKFDGKLNTDGSEFSGEWQQQGPKLPLTFRRVPKAAKLRRPQDPVPPYPYTAEDVTVENRGIKLAGTLTLPPGPGPHPAVVLITGSGPQDRDEAIMGHRPFLILADHLTRHGIAVLRYDDRGVGQSTGNFAQAVPTDFVSDALAAVSWLKKRPEIHPQRIGLVGHSEGGLVAPLAAAERPDDIAFIVLLAGVGVPMEELMIRQTEDVARSTGSTEAEVAKFSAANRSVYRMIIESSEQAASEKFVSELLKKHAEEFAPAQRAALGLTDTMLATHVKTITSPWFRQLIAYDPRPALQKVKCPVLAINGDKDVQVSAQENLEGIRAALAAGGNREVQIVSFPGLNHLFQNCTTGAVGEYGQIEETFAPVALDTVSGWIALQTKP